MDIFEYFDEKGIEYSTEGKNVSSGWIGIQCVFCDDQSNHLGINLTHLNYSCFICGSKGNIVSLIKEIENTSYHHAKKILSKHQTLKIPSYSSHSNGSKKTQFILPRGLHEELLETHKNYLQSRGFSGVYEKYQLKCFGPVGEYKLRLFIPVFLNGRMVSYTTRDVTNKAHVPYIHCPQEKSAVLIKHTLYNIDSVQDTAIVVEGVTDVWRIGSGSIASFGVNLTIQQIKTLTKIKRIFILFDNDAKKQAEKLAATLSAFTETIILDLPSGDPADLPQSDINQLRQQVFGKIYA